MCDSVVEYSTLFVENCDSPTDGPTKLGTEAPSPELKNASQRHAWKMKVFNLRKGNLKLFSDPTLTPKQLNIPLKETTNLELNKKFNSFVYVTLKSELMIDQYLKK